MLVLLDNGHGKDTPGKRSPKWPDGRQLFEYEFNRDIVYRIARMCEAANIGYGLLVPEIEDISLGERVRRANMVAKQHPGSFLISVHANAGGGTGWEAWTSPGQTRSDEIADLLYIEAIKALPGIKIRTDKHSDGDMDKESRFYILRKTTCPAVLTENLFMDNQKDCEYLLSDEGRQIIARLHFDAIRKIFKK